VYTITKKPRKTVAKKELKMNNKTTMDFIMKGLPDIVKTKLVQCASAKQLWDNLQYLYVRKGTKENEARDNSNNK
jgi:phage protein D